LKMQQSEVDQSTGTGKAPASSARRYVEFTLYSSPGKEADK
jgi:hypothetical protein